jgi:hypothetical protein
MVLYERNFTFDQGSLGRNLATMDEKVHHFIATDLNTAAARGREQMYQDRPWRDRTSKARNGLWSDTDTHGGNYRLWMGHGVQYGIYLEKSNGGRFQVVMPTLIATAHAFMESLIEMLHQLDNPAPVLGAIEPGIGAQRGTSQGATERAQGVKGVTEKTVRKPRVTFRNERGQFAEYKNVKLGTGHTKTTKTTAKTKKTKRA